MAESDITPMRICTKCQKAQPHSEYTKVSKTVIGLSSRCKSCAALYARHNKDRNNAYTLARYHERHRPLKEAKEEARAAKIAQTTKPCSSCKQTKNKSEFGPYKGRPDGLRPYCRECKAHESRRYREKNPETAALATKRWAEENPERRREIARLHQSKIHNRVHSSVSSRMYTWIKGCNGAKNGRTKDYLGYGWEELKLHIEKQFVRGMSWDNYGEWHIDHIRPLSTFHATSLADTTVSVAWALPNLRPLWAVDNLRKNAKTLFLI